MFTFKRNGIYYVEFFDVVLDKTRRISTKSKSLSVANEFILKLNNPAEEKKREHSITLIGFRSEYEQYAEISFSKKYQSSISLSFKKFIAHIGNPKITSISHRAVEKFLLLTFQKHRHSAYLYNRTLKAAFNKALRWSYLEENPFTNITLPKINKQIPIFINTSDLSKILEMTTNKKLKCLFKTAFYTGMRLGELANLRWESVDLIQKKIKVQIYDDFITKNRRERILPINKNIITDLRLLSKTRKSEYVFSNDNNYKYNSSYISHKFKRIVRQIGLPERIRFHTLRHSFASNLVQKGANLYAVKELLGHENISTTQIYAHLDSKTLENTVELL